MNNPAFLTESIWNDNPEVWVDLDASHYALVNPITHDLQVKGYDGRILLNLPGRHLDAILRSLVLAHPLPVAGRSVPYDGVDSPESNEPLKGHETL